MRNIHMNESAFQSTGSMMAIQEVDFNQERENFNNTMTEFTGEWNSESKQAIENAFNCLRAEGIECYRQMCAIQGAVMHAIETMTGTERLLEAYIKQGGK